MIAFPNIDPEIIHIIGPLSIRYYSLAYIIGILFTVYYSKYLVKKHNLEIKAEYFDEFMLYAIIGIVIGGRLGYVIIYDPVKYLEDPLEILKTYNGGLAFHGAIIGFFLSLLLFCRKHQLRVYQLLDPICLSAPLGIFFGRIANFINDELWGRVTDVPWAVLFPNGNYLPRHPSQIYEALLEGLLLFLITVYLGDIKQKVKKPYFISSIFIIGYSLARLIVENFREPDMQIGYILNFFTMGQILCLFQLIIGLIFLKKSYDYENKRKNL